MKKRIIALFMASLMALSMVACGSKADDNAKEAEALLAEIEELKAENDELKAEDESVEEKEEVANDSDTEVEEVKEVVEEAKEETGGDLWGTKRPVSATLTEQETGKMFNGTFEYKDDGSYVVTYRYDSSSSSNDYIYYYKPNGVLYYGESWVYDEKNPDGKKRDEQFCLFGLPIGLDPNSPTPSDAMEMYGVGDNFFDTVEITYDNEGNINNPEGQVLEYTDLFKTSNQISSGDYYVEYDEEGRLSKIIKVPNNSTDDYQVREINYLDDNKIDISAYSIVEDGYDPTTRSSGEVKKSANNDLHLVITMNEHGLPLYLSGMQREQENNNFEYIYDEYGFPTTILKNGQVKKTIEYVYE